MTNSNISKKEVFESAAYEIGKDFEISIADENLGRVVIEKLGEVKSKKLSLFNIQVKALITENLGKCYKIIVRSKQRIVLAYLLVRITMRSAVISKPKKLMVST